jgi:hypothetical protein
MLSTRRVQLIHATKRLYRTLKKENIGQTPTPIKNADANLQQYKRRCAIVLGYKGTNYYGSQVQLTGQITDSTISSTNI